MSAEAMIWGSLVGDALALGPHWIYDPEEIRKKIGTPDRLHDPISKYHPGKSAGDFTHYGDQALLFLRHLAASGKYDLDAFAAEWRAYWENPSTISYRDGATKGTLANLSEGVPAKDAGAHSHDLAGVSIIAPLFLLKWEDDESLVAACKELTAFTHQDATVIGAAEFFARTALACLGGKSIADSLAMAADGFGGSPIHGWFTSAMGSARSSEADGTVLSEYGLSCDVTEGFAGVCHLLLRYPEDPTAALVASAAAGGDSAARGMLLGMIYGASGQLGKIPADWKNGLHAADAIGDSIATIR